MNVQSKPHEGTVPAAEPGGTEQEDSELRRRRVGADWAPPVIAALAMLIVWELVVRAAAAEAYILPPPTDVFAELWTQRSLLASAATITTVEVLAGFGLAIAFSIPMALLIVASRPLDRAIFPLLVISQTVPKVAIAPLFVVWFGFAATPKILTAFLICFFPIVIDTVIGLRSVSPDSVDLLRSMGASRARMFRELRLPAALPYLFAGLKVAVTLAVVGAVVGEFVAANEGLGYLILNANAMLDTSLLFAALIILTAIGVVLYYLVEGCERLLIPWHVTQRDQTVHTQP